MELHPGTVPSLHLHPSSTTPSIKKLKNHPPISNDDDEAIFRTSSFETREYNTMEEDNEEKSSCLLSTGTMKNEVFVWPWKGIVANIPVQWSNGKYVGQSGSRLRDELTERGFNPIRVHTLWNYKGHTGFAIVEFRNNWVGLCDALRFEKAYEADHQGKKEFFESEKRGDGKLYCWVAREFEYNSRNVVGDHLKRNGDLKTLAQYQEEEKNKNRQLVANLSSTVEVQNMKLLEMETKYKETSISLSSMISEKDDMLQAFNEERERMQQNAHNHLVRILKERDRTIVKLEVKRNNLNQKEEELRKREAQNEHEEIKLEKLKNEQEQNDIAIKEQRRADEKLLKLAEYHKREKEKLQRRTMELEKKLDAKQALELEIRRLTGNLQVVKHMGGDDEDDSVKEKLIAINKELKDKEEELEYLDSLNQTLIVKERRSNDELQEARKELIEIFLENNSRSIGVKRMGELSSKAFIPAAKRKFPGEDAEVKAVKLCTQWDSYIRDANWHPFKVVPLDDGKGYKTILNEEDQKLKQLRNGLGEEAFEAVSTALMEMNEYNPSGRYIVPVLWDNKQQQRATLADGISVLIKQYTGLKKKKR